MNKKIKVQIYGAWDSSVSGGCSSGGCGGCGSKTSAEGSEGGTSKGCSGCHSGKEGGCSSKTPKSIGELYKELAQFIEASDVREFTELEFIDIRKINILDYDDVRILYDRGYELPYCVVDGIVRYYGGIAPSLVYKDIKELEESC